MMVRSTRTKEILYALYKAGVQSPREFYDKCIHEYRELRHRRIDFLDPEDERYPLLLKDRLKRPPKLFYKGPLKNPLRLLQRPGVAIVGSRNASTWGLKIAKQLAWRLANRGMNVISGYARGVDFNAHLGALRSRRGGTTIVLSEGICHFAPKGELRELEGWERRTLAISQFTPSAPWRASQAMTRNKLICALAHAVIVVEAGPEMDEQGRRSGTFHSGISALQLGVSLFIVDYSPLQAPLPMTEEGQSWMLPKGNQVLLEKGAQPLPIDLHDLERSVQRAAKRVWQVATS
jgi:DNA processing protein